MASGYTAVRDRTYVKGVSNSAATVVVPVPAATQNGDLMIAFVVTSGNNTMTGPAGGTWTQIYSFLNPSNVSRMTAWWRVASSEPANYTWTSGANAFVSGAIVSFYDTGGNSLSVDTSATVTTGHTTPSLTLAGNFECVIGVSGGGLSTVALGPNQYVNGWQNLVDITGTTGSENTIVACYNVLGATSSYTNASYVVRTSGSTSLSFTGLAAIAIKGSTAAPPSTSPLSVRTGATANISSSSVSTLSVTAPAGTVSGDVVFLVGSFSNSAPSTGTFASSGFTKLKESSDSRLQVFYKISSGSEPGSYTATWTTAVSGSQLTSWVVTTSANAPSIDNSAITVFSPSANQNPISGPTMSLSGVANELLFDIYNDNGANPEMGQAFDGFPIGAQGSISAQSAQCDTLISYRYITAGTSTAAKYQNVDSSTTQVQIAQVAVGYASAGAARLKEKKFLPVHSPLVKPLVRKARRQLEGAAAFVGEVGYLPKKHKYPVLRAKKPVFHSLVRTDKKVLAGAAASIAEDGYIPKRHHLKKVQPKVPFKRLDRRSIIPDYLGSQPQYVNLSGDGIPSSAALGTPTVTTELDINLINNGIAPQWNVGIPTILIKQAITVSLVNSIIKMWAVRGSQIAQQLRAVIQLIQQSPVDVGSVVGPVILLEQAFCRAQITAASWLMQAPTLEGPTLFSTLSLELQQMIYQGVIAWQDLYASIGSLAFSNSLPNLDAILQANTPSRTLGAVTPNPSIIETTLENMLYIPSSTGLKFDSFWLYTDSAEASLVNYLATDLVINNNPIHYGYADYTAALNDNLNILNNYQILIPSVTAIITQINSAAASLYSSTPVTSIRSITVPPNTDLPAIANSLMGDPDGWLEIVELNNLVWPYISSNPVVALGQPEATALTLADSITAGDTQLFTVQGMTSEPFGLYKDQRILIQDGANYEVATIQGFGTPHTQLETWPDPDSSSPYTHTYTLGEVPVVPGTLQFSYPTHEILNASNTAPIVITTEEPHHFNLNDVITVQGVDGNTAANGQWVITPIYNVVTLNDGQITASSNVFQSASASFSLLDVGAVIEAVGIPSGTSIVSITDSNHVVMSKHATRSATSLVTVVTDTLSDQFSLNGSRGNGLFVSPGGGGTAIIYAGAFDDGNGNINGAMLDTKIPSTINYATGHVSITWIALPSITSDFDPMFISFSMTFNWQTPAINLVAPVQHNYSVNQGTLTVYPPQYDAAKVVMPGQQIIIPVTPKNQNSFVVSSQQADEERYGQDIQVTPDGRLVYDNGDLALISGTDNLLQAVRNRMQTPQGTLVRHPDYGNPLFSLLGHKNDSYFAFIAGAYTKQSILSDPRVSTVSTFQLNIVGDKLIVDCAFQSTGNQLFPPTRFAVPIEV